MPNLEEVNNFIQFELTPAQEDLEKKRIRMFKGKSKSLLLSIFTGIFIAVIFSFILTPFGGFIVGSLVPFFLYKYLLKRKIKSFHKLFQEQIYRKLIAYILPEFVYQTESSGLKNHYLESGLYSLESTKSKKYYEGDLASGTFDGCSVEFSEFIASVKIRVISSDINGPKSTTSILPVFNGLFFTASLQKSYQGKTYILPGNEDKDEGALDEHLLNSIGTLEYPCEAGSPDFQKMFQVFSSNHEEANSILTPTLQNLLMDYRQKHPPLRISILGSRLYIALFSERFIKKMDLTFSSGTDNLPDNLAEEILFSLDVLKEVN
ncbi:MAG: DUF3137 domain-containing protein [Spirochaetia bacterium]|nr:DUF3137 domain-containing protein [Spirochaetia bacterium]